MAQDITDTQLIEKTLYFVAQSRQFESFFCNLVQYIGQTLGISHVFVGELLPDQHHIRTIAFYECGSIVENVVYELTDTPCQEVVGKNLCSYFSGVAQLFPKDLSLTEMHIESYAGIPLWKTNGHPLGILVLMDQKPFLNQRLAETVLQIVAIRAAHELERKQAEEALIYSSNFQSLITTLAVEFINLPLAKFDEGIQRALQAVGEFVGASRCSLNILVDQPDTYSRTHEWHRADVPPYFASAQNIDLKVGWATLMLKSRARDCLIIPDVSALTDQYAVVKQHLAAQGAQAFIAIPLYEDERIIGFTSLHFPLPNSFPHLEDTVKLLRLVSETFVNALDRKHSSDEIRDLTAAEEVERRHRIFTESLVYTGAALSSTLRFDDLVDIIFDCMQRVVNYDTAMIMRVVEAQQVVEILASRGYPPTYAQRREIPLENLRYIQQMLQTHEMFFVPDTRFDAYFHTGIHYPEIISFLGVPVLLDEQLIGILILGSFKEDFYQGIEMHYLNIFAQQVGLAIRNARFHAEALQVATLKERQRLARDLHDSVNQTLFSAATLAELVSRLIDKDPEEAKQYSRDVAALASTAMAEMRTLLIELRPEALAKTELGVLIQQLCDTLAGNTSAEVVCTVRDKFILPETLQIVFYRVAQEALNNILKHAHATLIRVELKKDEHLVELMIQDNGCGFSQDQLPPDHFGLKIMQERAQSIEAEFIIRSSSEGTEIILRKLL